MAEPDAHKPSGLLIAGTGRGGTSVAAKLAGQLGLRLPTEGDLMPANDANPDGYWESMSLARFNARLLNRWSTSWWQPPAEVTQAMVDELADAEEEALTTFTESFGTADGWVWKDPRLVMLLPFWDRVLGRQPVLLPYREPQAVAHSIATRDGLSYEEGLAIWERHTRLALASVSGRFVAVLSYARLCQDASGWRSELLQLCRRAGLPVVDPPALSDGAVIPSNTPTRGRLSAQQRALHALLVQCEGVHDAFPAVSIPDETPSVGGTLGRLQVPLYVRYERLLGEHQQLAAHRDQIRAEYRAALRQIAGLRDETTNLRSDYARLQSEYERLQAAQTRLRAQYDQVVASRSYRLSVTLGRLRDRTLGPVRTQGRSSRRSGSEDGTLRDGDT